MVLFLKLFSKKELVATAFAGMSDLGTGCWRVLDSKKLCLEKIIYKTLPLKSILFQQVQLRSEIRDSGASLYSVVCQRIVIFTLMKGLQNHTKTG